LAAGLDGIEQKLEPTPITTGNGYLVEDAEAIPTDLGTAVARARASAFMKDVCGGDALEILIQQSERELAFIAQQITPVEMQRYLGNF
jgi:glutamine synthetase